MPTCTQVLDIVEILVVFFSSSSHLSFATNHISLIQFICSGFRVKRQVIGVKSGEYNALHSGTIYSSVRDTLYCELSSLS